MVVTRSKIQLGIIAELERNEDYSFNIDGAKWIKGVKIVGCGNAKSLTFLTS